MVLPSRCCVRTFVMSSSQSHFLDHILCPSVYRTILSNNPTHPHAASNLLSFLEKLTTFPTDSSELNAWWVEELGAKPKPPKKPSKVADDEDEDEDEVPKDEGENGEDEEDDWRKFFDEDQSKSSNTDQPKTTSKPHRLHTLTLHQSLHALPSHRAVFTRCWLSLLLRISLADAASPNHKKELSSRALSVMHVTVLPHLTRAILVMDWVAACVDYGGNVGLLALNGLFVLIKEYNLCAFFALALSSRKTNTTSIKGLPPILHTAIHFP